MSLILVLILCSIRYLFIIKSDSKKFMTVFFRIDTKEAKQTKSLLQKLAVSLETNIEQIQISEEDQVVVESANNTQQSTVAFRKASNTKLFIYQVMLFSRLLPFLLIYIGGSAYYFIRAKTSITDIQQEQQQIKASLVSVYQTNLICAELIEIVLANSTTTIRGAPIEENYQQNTLRTMTIQSFIDTFRNLDGDLTQLQENLFFGFSCNELKDINVLSHDSTFDSCQTISLGTNKVGLVDLLTQMYQKGTQYYEVYKITPKIQSNLYTLFYKFVQVLNDLSITTITSLLRLYQATADSFQVDADAAKHQAVISTVLTLNLVLVGSIMLWILVLKKIFKHHRTDREILQLVPISTLLNNRYLRQYLIRNSNGILEPIKKI